MSLPIMTSGGPSIGCEASQPFDAFRYPFGVCLCCRILYMYIDVDSQPSQDRSGVAYIVDTEESVTTSLLIMILSDPSIGFEASNHFSNSEALWGYASVVALCTCTSTLIPNPVRTGLEWHTLSEAKRRNNESPDHDCG